MGVFLDFRLFIPIFLFPFLLYLRTGENAKIKVVVGFLFKVVIPVYSIFRKNLDVKI